MVDAPRRSWSGIPIGANPFALPHGPLGPLAGRMMARVNQEHHDALRILDVPDGAEVLEVGPGPGTLLGLIAGRTGARRIIGVDPSAQMCELARSRNRSAVTAGRVEVRIGSAHDTGCPEAAVDRLISMNTVLMWPDLLAGTRESYRVVRPGGLAVVAWHGGTAPGRIARRMALSEEHRDRMLAAFGAVFRDVRRHESTALTAFVLTR